MTQQVQAPPVDASASATDVIAAPSRGVTSRHVRLAALPSAVPWARRVLAHMLREWQLEHLSDPALLLVSELVTNAVQASARRAWRDPGRLQMIALSLEITDTELVTEVWDASPAGPALREADLTGDRGRGLLLVDYLADAWGHRPADGGKVVWCEVAIPA
ncbi:MAG: ATP-binding protein [Streptosporangiaceae bacterium]